jgi:hypothetical protein
MLQSSSGLLTEDGVGPVLVLIGVRRRKGRGGHQGGRRQTGRMGSKEIVRKSD